MWVCLNDEGKKVWGGIFPDGKVPVCSQFADAELSDKSQRSGWKTERVILVNWSALTEHQKISVLRKISAKTGADETVILKDLEKIGLPLRESYTTGTVANELRFFI